MPWGATPEEQKSSPLHAVFGSKAFLADRAQLSGGRPINVEALRSAQPFLLDQLLANLETLESILHPSQHAFQQHQNNKAEGGWILGTDKPTASDISIFGILWWLLSTKRAAEYVTPAVYPGVFAWFAQMKAFMKKHAHPTLDQVKFSGEEALAVARGASLASGGVYEPTGEGVHHPLEKRQVGELVTVSPNDYGKVPVRGVIVEITTRRVAIRPEALAAYPDIRVVMHFPRSGYIILPVTKAQL